MTVPGVECRPAQTARRYRITVLGPFELTGPDGPIDLGGKKLKALVAYLAIHGEETHPRRELMKLLWGAHFETQAQQNLRQALSRIRREFPESVLVGEGEHIAVDRSLFDVDADRFAAHASHGGRSDLTAAVALRRGSFLADLEFPETGFAAWREVERRRLDARFVDVCCALAGIELESGQASEALRHAGAALQLEPLREDASRIAIRARTALGQRSEALRQYAELERQLRVTFDALPEPATSELGTRLRGASRPEARTAADDPLDADAPTVNPVSKTAGRANAWLARRAATLVGAFASIRARYREMPARDRTLIWAALVCGTGLVGWAGWSTADRPALRPGEALLSGEALAEVLPHLNIEGIGIFSGVPYAMTLGADGRADVEQFTFRGATAGTAPWREQGRWWREGDAVVIQFDSFSQNRRLKRWVARRDDGLAVFLGTKARSPELAYRRSDTNAWGALALSGEQVAAAVWGQASRNLAEAAVRGHCKAGETCTVEAADHGACIAYAAAPQMAGGSATVQAPVAALSRELALSRCREATHGEGCVLRTVLCADGRHRFFESP